MACHCFVPCCFADGVNRPLPLEGGALHALVSGGLCSGYRDVEFSGGSCREAPDPGSSPGNVPQTAGQTW